MLSTFSNHPPQIHPRSVLRPEYLNKPSAIHNAKQTVDKRLNTNTAPVYPTDPISINKRACRRSLHYPYPRPFKSHLKHNSEPHEFIQGNSTSQSVAHRFPVRPRLSTPESDSSSISHSGLQNFRPGDFTPHFSRSSRDSSISARSSTHGQAEQLRRSRESNTFALIDAQLSKPPLNKVREMYVRSRSASNPSANHSSSRTTKKVNLSVVHLFVRFRIKNYLLAMQDYAMRLLDTLLSNMFDYYEPEMRSDLSSRLFGVQLPPCSARCRFCPALVSPSRRVDNYCNSYDDLISNELSTPASSPGSLMRPSSCSSENSTAPMLSVSDAPSDSHEGSSKVIVTDIPETNLPTVQSIDDQDFRKPNQLDLTLGHSFEKLPSPDSLLLPSTSPTTRRRLDSFTLRICGDFDNIDWISSDMGFNYAEDEPVDLHSMVNESAPDFLQLREPLFDVMYDHMDILQPFVPDKQNNALGVGAT